MRLGFIILAHENLHRVGQVLDHLTSQNCPVALHIDAHADKEEFDKLYARFGNNELVKFTARFHCQWGCFSLVQATLDASEAFLKAFPNVQHVTLLSGACLPIRPINQLKSFLSRNSATDFVESVSVKNERWVKGGLNEERFKFYFPVSWRNSRWVFDRLVGLQRRFKVSRKIPDGVNLFMGSQWWCLTRKTLDAILNDPRRPEFDRFFKKTWIPDESYFQSLARLHSERLESRSLTFAKFDSQGKPFILYDDHFRLMEKADAFFVRKVWAGADQMYEKLLDKTRSNIPMKKVQRRQVISYFDAAIQVRKSGGIGHYMAGRFPKKKLDEAGPTVAPYTVFVGPNHIFPEFPDWLAKQTETIVHGNLFERQGFHFANDAELFTGNLVNNVRIRNRNPRSFLSNLLWNENSERQSFQFNLQDHHRVRATIMGDPNAHIVFVKDSWLLPFRDMKATGANTLSKAQNLQQIENKFLAEANHSSAKAKLTLFELQDVLENPTSLLTVAQESVGHEPQSRILSLPNMVDLKGLPALAKRLRNQGLSLPPIKLNRVNQRSTHQEKLKAVD